MPTATKECYAVSAICPFATPRRRRRWHNSILAAITIGIAGGGFIIGVGWTLYAAIQPPVTVQNSTILNNEVEQGGDLKFLIQYMTTVDRSCLGTVTREFYVPYDRFGRTLREKKRISGPPPIVIEGETEYVIDVALPPNMAIGDWEFQGETSYDCGYIWALVKDFPRGVLNGGVKRFRTRIMPFKVVPPKPVAQK